MTLLSTIIKTDEDVLDYDTTFDLWLADGDTLADATASIEDSTEETTTIAVAETSFTDTTIKVRLEGGVDGESATLKILATTANGLVKEVSYRLRIKGA